MRIHRSCLLAGAVVAVSVWGCGGSTGSAPPPAAAATSEQPSPDQPKDGPPEAIVKKLLEKDMWGPLAQGGTRHTYNYGRHDQDGGEAADLRLLQRRVWRVDVPVQVQRLMAR